MSRLEQIQAMLADSPDDVFLNFALAMEYVKAGRPAEAVARFARVTELDPDHTAAYSQRANVLIDLGQKTEAQAALNDGIAAAQRMGDAHAVAEMRKTLSLIT